MVVIYQYETFDWIFLLLHLNRDLNVVDLGTKKLQKEFTNSYKMLKKGIHA